MMKQGLLAASALMFSPFALAANLVDLNISENAVAFKVDFDLQRNVVVDGSVFHHQDRGTYYGAGLHVVGLATGGPQPVTAGVGGRLLFVDSDVGNRDDGFMLPIGGWVRYTVPDYDRFIVGGSLYYAPDILSFGDGTGFTEYNIWGAYTITRQAEAYLGLRGIHANFEGASSVRLDRGLHFGLRLAF
jgi:hypothetical protein